MPARILIRPAAPKIKVPSKRIGRLPAQAAEARTSGHGGLAKWCRWHAKARRQIVFLTCRTEAPDPSIGSTGSSNQQPRQSVGTHWMRAPIRVDSPARRRRNEWFLQSVRKNGRRENGRQRFFQARERLPVSCLTPFRHG